MSGMPESSNRKSAHEHPIPDLFIADWSNIVHRAFHGLGAYSDLLATDVVHMAQNIILETALQHCFLGARIAFVMDGGYSGRKQIYPEYKANRSETTDRPMPLIVALEGNFPQSVFINWRGTPVRAHGFESDDVMIGLAREHQDHGGLAFIFSNDGDMLQAVNGNITVLSPRKYPDPPVIYDWDAVIEKYGFTPDKIPHFKALQGDTADNIPRVPRVGEGIAAKLICQYGSIAGAIMAAGNGLLTPVVGRNILANIDNIRRNLRLVSPVCVPQIREIYEGVMSASPSIV
jgi:DNA polymerase I